MNKKIIVLLIAVFSIMFVIVVSVLGKVPESDSRVSVDSIMFVDPSTEDGFCEVTEKGQKIIYITRGTTEYQLNYLINPTDATEQDVTFQVLTGQEHIAVSEEGLVTFYSEVSVTIKIYSNLLDFKSDVVIIEFKGNTSTVIPDEDDPF